MNERDIELDNCSCLGIEKDSFNSEKNIASFPGTRSIHLENL